MEGREALGQELYELGLRLGNLGALAVGSGGGPLARALARLVGCGAALAGGDVKFHDGDCAACGAWVGRYYDLPAALFIRQAGDGVELYLSDGEGRSFHRRLDGGGPASAVGEWDLLAGADCAWAACRVGEHRAPGGLAAAEGPAALTLALERLGLEAEDVLFCGDTVIDAATAQAGGCRFCAVLNGTTRAQAFDRFPSVHIAPDLADLKNWLAV